jgi:hypothetical protein
MKNKGNLMKTIYLLTASLVLTAATAHAGNSSSSLSGVYEVIKSGCADALPVGEQGVEVQAGPQEVSVKAEEDFITIYDFVVGVDRVNCMGDCYSLYEGVYAPGNTEFDVQRLYAGTLGAPATVLAGNTRFSISGDILEITSTDNGQDQPGPAVTCQLKKTQ